jgi:beta-lactam-binding protein with PASTA domain
MEKDQTRRYRSAEEMRDDLARVVSGRSVAATPRVEDTTVMPAVGPATAQNNIKRVSTQKSGINPWVWVGVVVAAILVGLGIAAALGAFSAGPTVPSTSGMTVEVARQAIVDAGFKVGAETSASDPAIPEGQVIKTDPAAGAPAVRGQSILIVVSSGPEQVSVPPVVGSAEASAVVALQDAGFDVDPMITREFNTKYDYGMVFKTEPAPGVKAAKGSKVRIWVSQGAEMKTVPSVVGKTEADATDALNKAGFDVKVTKKSDPTAAKGSVIEQTPLGATQAPKGSAVTIVVSTGPEQVTITNLVGLTEAEAVAKINAMGLLESVQTLTGSLPADIGKVKDQDPPTGTKVNKGSTVTIWVGGT